MENYALERNGYQNIVVSCKQKRIEKPIVHAFEPV
jgi:hypothetical protein